LYFDSIQGFKEQLCYKYKNIILNRNNVTRIFFKVFFVKLVKCRIGGDSSTADNPITSTADKVFNRCQQLLAATLSAVEDSDSG